MTFSYNRSKKHPRPELSVRVRNPQRRGDSNSLVSIDAFIDSGADMTCIPQSTLQNLGNLPKGHVTVQGINDKRKVTTYFVDIEIVDDELLRIEVVAAPHSKAVIGRDILNKYKVVLNGPNNNWKLNCTRNCD
jgi:predicted aspartyl protease